MKEDVPYGRGLIKLFRPFIEEMIQSGLSQKTLKKHLDNLWLLGGEIIRDINTNDEYDTPPIIKLNQSVGPTGGPYCRHLQSDGERVSFDRTCRKLWKHLESVSNN